MNQFNNENAKINNKSVIKVKNQIKFKQKKSLKNLLAKEVNINKSIYN